MAAFKIRPRTIKWHRLGVDFHAENQFIDNLRKVYGYFEPHMVKAGTTDGRGWEDVCIYRGQS